jgi:hypothetical protein
VGVAAVIDAPFPADELRRFFASMLYGEEAFLVDRVVSADPISRSLVAECDTARPLPVARYQRGDEALHPRHVSGPDLLLLTGNLGSLHAWFFHGVRFDEGWVGFGARIHEAEFRGLARIGPTLTLRSVETKSRIGPKRVVSRYQFEFEQSGAIVYRADQSAIFVRPDRGDAL